MVKRLAIIAFTIMIGKILAFLFGGVRSFLEAADKFVSTGVTQGQPFHFLMEYYRQFMHDAFSQPNGNLGTMIGALFAAFFGAIGEISREGLAAVLTMAVVLLCGIAATYDRKNDHPILTALICGPLIGGCVLYALMGLMWVMGWIAGLGARALTLIGAAFPLVKEGAEVFVESKKEKAAELVVERVARGGR